MKPRIYAAWNTPSNVGYVHIIAYVFPDEALMIAVSSLEEVSTEETKREVFDLADDENRGSDYAIPVDQFDHEGWESLPSDWTCWA